MTVRARVVFPEDAGTFRHDAPGNPRAGCCTLCRSSKASAEKPCVELGPNSRAFREGQVVLCFNCATEVGVAVGMLPAGREAELIAEAAGLRTQIDHLNAELEAFGSLRAALDRLAATPAPAGAKAGGKG